jgi:hypothetical protein
VERCARTGARGRAPVSMEHRVNTHRLEEFQKGGGKKSKVKVIEAAVIVVCVDHKKNKGYYPPFL